MKRENENRLTYEEAFEKLEKRVNDLESGELTLERSLEVFEECVRLVAFCSKKLEETERKIELLVSKDEGAGEPERSILEFEE